ncbi:MAG TPA: hypothetical protein VGN74_01270 [Brevundimonas sp.]|jgi:hypothetical protein|uniref:hypothetical protein n=1 Tax=Brevundimonas sp. TaxID=1871086 RepID=UPI002E165813|nr:hypothetical protein [Brevundimonas sp.]
MSFMVGVAALILAQDPVVSRDCLDDNGVDRCDSISQAATRARLGVTSIEDEAASGAEVYRAFYVDGYGQEMPAVAFERRPGASPVATVYGFAGQTLSGPVSFETWNRVRTESRFADRQLEQLPAAGGFPSICLHSWVSTVEMANSSPERFRLEPVRRRTEDACSDGLTVRFAFRLAEIAVETIAPCDQLETTRYRSHVNILAACMALRGDRFTAVELRNARSEIGPRRGLDPADPRAWRAALGTNGSPVLNWAGVEVRTERGRDNRVAEFIVARLAELDNLRFEQRTFEGLDARRGLVTGVASYRAGDDRRVAPYRQLWVWDPNLSEWMLSEWIIDPFAPEA